MGKFAAAMGDGIKQIASGISSGSGSMAKATTEALINGKGKPIIGMISNNLTNEALEKVGKGVVYGGMIGAGLGVMQTSKNFDDGLISGIGGTALDIVGGTAGGVAAGAIGTSVVANIAEAISKTKVR